MFGVSHRFGRLPVKKEMFMIMFRGTFNLSLNSYRIRFGTEFGPTAFLVLILPVMLIIFQLLVVVEGGTNFYFPDSLRSVYWILVFFDQFFFVIVPKNIELLSNFFLLLVVKLLFIFRRVGCTLLCFL